MRSDDEDLFDKITDITHGRMINAAFDAVGLPVTTRAALDSLDVYGRAVLVGLSPKEVSIGPGRPFAKGR
ncbi:MAG: zinc-binding dehydrogenase [Actinomycetaceae bacterium]|nr:zinc-binding dehydrogenase [Arcanobacterium sp.]MDD7505805.1 zinc-binding dehydrogenase [Actinomycetaceae bacterium]MDY6142884.1 zinc-binding dehydrogenase [Arcanobacterium sp.]